MYCVECGAEGKVYENLCMDCFIRKTNFFKLPKVIKLKICSHCHAWENKNHWEASASEEDAIRQLLNKQISKKSGVKNLDFSIEHTTKKTNIDHAKLEIHGTFEDLEIKEVLFTEIRFNYATCGRCSRLSGSYFEAKIQVRGTNRPLDDDELKRSESIVDALLNESQGVEYNAFLTKYERIHGGEDFYIGSATVAQQIAKRLSKEFLSKIKESSSLIGRKDGREIYRTTYNVRIPEYRVDDFVDLDKRTYQILNIFQKRVLCVDLKTGQTRQISHEAILHGTVLGGGELTNDAVVILDKETEVQILDPDNYQTLELVKPKNFEVKGETVKIFKVDDRILLIPNKKLLRKEKR